MRRAVAPIVPTLLVLALSPSLAVAQDPVDALEEIQSRTLAELLQALTGRPFELSTLVGVALERSLTLEVEFLNREVYDAQVSIERGLFDPAFTLGSTLARSGLTGAPDSRSAQAGVGAVLPWGTKLGVQWSGGQNLDFIADPTIRYGSSLALNVSQPLLEGLGVTNARLASARRQRAAAVHHYRRARETLVTQIEFLYWDLAEAEAVEAVLQRSFELSEAFLFRNEELASRALIAEVDVITAQSGRALRRAAVIDARRRRIDAAEQLVFAVYGAGAAEALAYSTPIKTSTRPPTPPPDLEDPGQESWALEQRADVLASRDQVESASELLRQARSGLRPGLYLDGAWTGSNRAATTGSAFGGLREQAAWSLGLRMSVPLGNQADRGRHQSARLSLSLSRVALDLAENRVRQDVREAVRAVRSGVERLLAGEEAALLAGAQLRAERQRLDLGLGDSFRLLQTEENAVRAELEQVRSRFEFARAVAQLRLARGEVLDGPA